MAGISADDRDQIAKDVGLLVLAFAKLEMEIDDLVCLIGTRFEDFGRVFRKFPSQWAEKLAAIDWAASQTDASVDQLSGNTALEDVKNLRDQLVHGKLIQPDGSAEDYSFAVMKFTRPVREDGRQRLMRTLSDRVSKRTLVDAVDSVRSCSADIDLIAKAVFAMGRGWPNHVPDSSGDPLNLAGGI